MAVISKLDYKGQDITKYNNETISNINFNGVDYHFAKPHEVLDGVCKNAVSEPLVDIKISGNSKQGVLPSEYQQVEYLENKGTQFIDTGLIPTGNTGIDLVYQAMDYVNSQYIAGSRADAYGTIAYAVNGSSARTDWDVRFNSNAIYSEVPRTDNVYRTVVDITNGNGTWTLTNLDTGESNEFSITNRVVTATVNLFLFAYNNMSIHANLRIYGCKIYEGAKLLRDFVPCYRKTDSVAGLYDMANGVFYTNAGGGSFTIGKSIPNPDAPVEIESVGEKTKNLLDFDGLLSNWGISYNKNDNVYSFDWNGDSFSHPQKLNLEVGKTYTFSLEATNLNTTIFMVRIDIRKGTSTIGTVYSDTGGKVTFTVEENTDYLIRLNYSSGSGRLHYFHPQLEEGENKTDYEPFGYKIPIEVSGKNLVSLPQSESQEGGGSTVPFERMFPNTPAGKYRFSADVKVEGYQGRGSLLAYGFKQEEDTTTYYGVFLYYSNYKGEGRYSVTFTTTEPLTFFYVYIHGGCTGGTITLSNRMLTRDDEDLTYEPYIEPTTTNIYLNEPLRRVGDYADCVDYKNKKVVRLVGKTTFDGTEEWVQHTTTNGGYGVFRNENYLTPLIGSPINSTLMTHFGITSVGSTASWDLGWYRFAYSEGSLIASSRLYVSAEQTTIEDFCEWLSDSKPSIVYPLATPTEETIESPEISTFDGTNVFDIKTTIKPSEFEINYWKQI